MKNLLPDYEKLTVRYATVDDELLEYILKNKTIIDAETRTLHNDDDEEPATSEFMVIQLQDGRIFSFKYNDVQELEERKP